MTSAFRVHWQPAEGDCVISVEYNSELLNHGSQNWEVLTGRKYAGRNAEIMESPLRKGEGPSFTKLF